MAEGRDKAGVGGQDASYVREAFAKIADRYVVTNHVLSAGTDILWRKKVARQVASWQPQRILDVACGTGDLALEMQRACPAAELVATDFCPEMLAHATRRGVGETQVADAMDLPFVDGAFDVVTVAFGLRNMADWAGGLREMARVAQGGRVVVLDFSLPKGPLAKPYGFYLDRVLPKIAGLLTGQGQAFEYLAGSIEKFPSGPDMVALFESCGLREVTAKPLSGGIASLYTGFSPAP
ncbi:ubiquinone/menaquinone biosynthesis methyltransferase [Roseibacillus ishigakijimensis]|uniref:Demethylmenaquinone methyltransferase n=1 Tax=Roseibacillus ishigakijimensis TaxID=454146 RepID=A0A934VM14_9BACT|nr:ubiquinone/menaquinone biosynthesis methyltransferase [Roseibacillus ishigakijimensis]MBK1833480.1 ubiquinone/menaquinone biosynthesis methyltransferase [Roseibacillus ishigakijimensis]